MPNESNPVQENQIPAAGSTQVPDQILTDVPPTPNLKPPQKSSKNILVTLLLSILVLLSVSTISYYLYTRFVPNSPPVPIDKPPVSSDSLGEFKVEKFKSKEEFAEYLSQVDSVSFSSFNGSTMRMQATDIAMAPETSGIKPLGSLEGSETTNRVSSTNVQVMGIDEPDIVKTDGSNIYYSSSSYGYRPMPEPIWLENTRVESSMPPAPTSKTRIISTLPANMEELSSFLETGELLLHEDTLIVFAGDRFIGFDVSDPANPKEVWQHELEDKTRVLTSRLFNDKLYVVTASYVDRGNPCPVPLLQGNTGLIIPCTDIYRPTVPVSADSVHTLMQVDPSDGSINKKTSFIGSENSTVVYMSPGSVYLAYNTPIDTLEIYLDFFITKLDDILPSELIEKMKKINAYDLSTEAKMLEFEKIFESYEDSLFDDSDIEEVVEKRLEEYLREKAREFSKTGIVKIDVNNFDIDATTSVPGALLNQFSMDEYAGNLRVATTVGDSMFGSTEFNENDLYILGPKLDLVGSVKGMGVDERIYSVRFIKDKGYIVTFKQIDPFYVLDLSDPTNPEIKGELKIPGYSSYLHPVDTNKILGVGKEDSKVKLSLFNVENPESPVEVSKYILDDYHSDILNNHHAFLHDPEKEVFFLPGSNKGYVFSYSQDNLSQKLEIEDINAQRALYINDNLYIVGTDKIVVFDENTWEQVSSLDLN